jgi:uncharacterized protein (DUF362 family)
MSAIGATAGMLAARPASFLARPAPVGRVAVATCREYGPGVAPVLATLFDQIGGVEKLVRGKTVALKINMVGNADQRLGHIPHAETYWVHPDVIAGTVHLLSKAGAYRVRVVEGLMGTAEPVPEFMIQANWEPQDIVSAGTRVEFENTNFLGSGKKYVRFMVPGGGLAYKGYDLNHSYADCDVFVSLTKMKEHLTAGVTLSMKNCFGITPCTIYGDGAPEDVPGVVPRGGRGPFHNGDRLPPKSAPPAVDFEVAKTKDEGYRVPRVIADLVSARPVHLAIIDGIHTMAGGEGPWAPKGRAVKPGLLVAGTNCVNTDAVAMALMGFDPMADRGSAPFETADSTLRLAEGLGVGSRDLKQIEVVGPPIERIRFDYRSA